MTNFRIKVL